MSSLLTFRISEMVEVVTFLRFLLILTVSFVLASPGSPVIIVKTEMLTSLVRLGSLARIVKSSCRVLRILETVHVRTMELVKTFRLVTITVTLVHVLMISVVLFARFHRLAVYLRVRMEEFVRKLELITLVRVQ